MNNAQDEIIQAVGSLQSIQTMLLISHSKYPEINSKLKKAITCIDSAKEHIIAALVFKPDTEKGDDKQ